ncbi:unnamed protein product [Closterium sp. Naga37s-1]|nr:unnamed protein product [Closterium sp. Naga37s-1]
MVICGTMLFFVFLLILSGTSPKSEQTAPVLEVGTAPDSVRQRIADADTKTGSSGSHNGKEDSPDSGGKLQIFSGAMAGMLSTDEPFTLFAPSDDFLLDISSVFHKYPRTKELIDPMLSRLVGYSAVPRRIPAADIPLGAFERLESITGFIINVGRDPRTGRIFANGVPSKQVDILEGQLVVHLIDGMLGPLDFVESVRSMDPDDVSMEAALEQEFNSGAFVRGSESNGGGGGGEVGGGEGGGGGGRGEGGGGGGGTGKGADEGTRQGEAGQAAQGEQTQPQQQQQQQQQQQGGDGQAEKVFLPEEQADLGAAVAATAAAAGVGGGGGGGEEEKQQGGEVGRSIEGQGENAGELAVAAAGADGTQKERGEGKGDGTGSDGGGGSSSRSGNTVGSGAANAGMDSDARNRDEFVHEGNELLEANEVDSIEDEPGEEGPGGEGGSVGAGGGTAGAGQGGGSSAIKAQPAGFGWKRLYAGLPGVVLWQKQNTTGVEGGGAGGGGGGNGEGGGAAGGGFQWFGFGKGGAASKKEPEEDPVDNLPILKPEVIAQEQVREEEKAKPGVEVDFRGEHKGASVIEVPPPVDPTKLPCLGRGILQADNKCICAVLYGGDNCEETRNTDKLTVDPYVGSYLLTAQAVMPPPPPAAGEEGSSGGGGGGSAVRSAMLLEGLSIEERRQLRAVLPLTDIYQTTVWKTCAVVGNSGALLLREDGEEIDKHDMVLRFNTAPTKGYEKQVGRKTTIRLSIPDKAGFREGNETVVYHLYLRGVKDELQHLLNFKRVFREGPLYVLDLGFESQIFNTFGAFTSVGYVGIQFALQKCHHIDLYGLFLSERHGVRHHYYNRDEYMPAQVTSEQLDREFVQSIEIADAELMWIADPCLYGGWREEVTSEQLDGELVHSIEIANAELMWIADPCLYACACERQWTISARKQSGESQQLALNARREQLKKSACPLPSSSPLVPLFTSPLPSLILPCSSPRCHPEWTTQQLALNARREQRWQEFLKVAAGGAGGAEEECAAAPFLPLRSPSPLHLPWTSQQLALNSRREQRWREFLKWQLVVREELKKSVRLQFQMQAERRRMRSSSGGLGGGSRVDGSGGDGRSGRGRGGLDAGGAGGRGAGGGVGERGVGGGSGGVGARGGSLPGESEDEYDSIDWERVVVEDMLDKLSMHEVLLYFRRNHITIPDTRAQMLQAVKAHYFFLRGELQKQKNRLYRPSD